MGLGRPSFPTVGNWFLPSRMAPGSVGEAFLYLIAFVVQDYPQLDIERSL